MKQKVKWGFRKAILLLVVLAIYILGSSAVVKADINSDDIEDGIAKWSPQSSTTMGYRKINDNLQVGYTFDGWRNGEGTVLWDGNSGSKFNVFLQKGNSQIPTIYNASGVPGTSLDFGIVYKNNEVDNSSTDGNLIFLNNVTGKKYFVGTDEDGNQVSKVMGNYSATDSAGTQHNFEMELLLRPSVSNSNAVSRELYLKNTQTTSQNYGILFGEDTDLNGNDGIKLNALAANSGLYMADGTYKLTINRNIANGPTAYTGQNFNNFIWFNGFNPQNFSGTGAEVKNLNAGDLLFNASDSSYTLKWPFKTIGPGETDHYASELGVNESGNSVASVQKSFTNQTSTDGKNRVGDNLSFKISATNNGYNSQWDALNFKDVIPQGLKIDTGSIKLVTASGSQDIAASNYDANTQTLDISTSENLKDNQSATITFDAKIAGSTSDTTLTNSATVSGVDALASGTPNVSATGSVNIPVEKSPYLSTFTKQVKNNTAGDADYQNSTTGVYGDVVSYQMQYGVNSDSQYSLVKGKLQDKLPDGLTLVPGSIQMTANGTTSEPTDLSEVTLPKLMAGQSATIDFDAKVTGTTPINLINKITQR